MGLFSTKKKHYVDSQVVRLVPDDMIPNAIYQALARSLINGDELVATLQEVALNGPHRKFDRYYNYAESGAYAFGLPNSIIQSNTAGYALAKAAIEDEVGQEVFIEYMHFRPLNNLHAGWKYITEELGYNHTTNELEVLTAQAANDPDRKFYLKKMVAVTQSTSGQGPEPSSQGNFGNNPSAGFTMFQPMFDVLNALTPEDIARVNTLRTMSYDQEVRIGVNEVESVEIHWSRIQSNGNERTGFIVVNLTSYDTDQEYYQAKYTYLDNGEVVTGYWIYDALHGTQHPELNGVFALPEAIAPGTYFPFVSLRAYGGSRAHGSLIGTPDFESTKKLLSFLDLDFEEMANTIDSDPDAEDIEQAALIMAVPINSEDPVDIEYLIRYFTELAANLPYDTVVVRDRIQELTTQNGGPDIAYKITITDLDFQMTLSFDEIEIRLQPGLATATGDTFANLELSETVELLGNPLEGAAPLKTRVLREQVSPNVFKEIRITNPVTRYTIYKELGAEGGFDDERCLIPLDAAISREMPVLLQQTLYYRSLYLVFNSHVVVKKKWYESGAFKIVLAIAAVVITIWSAGTATPVGQALFAAVAAGSVTTALVIAFIGELVVNFLLGTAISFALQLAVEVIGAEWGMYLAIAAAIVGGYKAYQAGSIVAGSTASNLLTASNGLFAGVSAEVQNDFVKLQEEQRAFDLLQEQKWDELAKLKKEMDSGIDIDPFTFIGLRPLTILGEQPSDYINRSAHTGNVGASSLNLIQNFVDYSLTLPTMPESIGAFSL